MRPTTGRLAVAATLSLTVGLTGACTVGGLHAPGATGAVRPANENAPPASVNSPPMLRVDCASGIFVEISWTLSDQADRRGAKVDIYRDDRLIGTATGSVFSDHSVAPSTRYAYRIQTTGSSSRVSEMLALTTPALSSNGDAPYCASTFIESMHWEWQHAYRAAEGSDLWPVTWGADGRVYAAFGDGGGFHGDDLRGRSSFGVAAISGRPPLEPRREANIYGGLAAQNPSRLSGKARSIIAVGRDFYAIASIFKPTDARYGRPFPISGAPSHVEIIYSRGGAHDWQDSGWMFCRGTPGAPDDLDTKGDFFCPSGFLNAARAAPQAADGYVYLFGASAPADRRLDLAEGSPAARTYLARVRPQALLRHEAYRYFAGMDAQNQPVWTERIEQLRPIFIDRNPPRAGCGGSCEMASTLEEVIYDLPLKRFIGIAQGASIAQTSFYESPHPWGPWRTIEYNNVDPGDGGGGWAALGIGAGQSLGVHPVNAWTGSQGKSLWMVYSSDGVAPSSSAFPAPGSKLDAFHLVQVHLSLARGAAAHSAGRSAQTRSAQPCDCFAAQPLLIPHHAIQPEP